MSFVDYQHVPIGLLYVVRDLVVLEQELQRNQRQLFFLKGIIFCASAAIRIEESKLQVKAAAHLYQPLVLQVFRYHNQSTANAARLQLAVQYQTCFDGFTQPHFIGEQYAWRHAVSDIPSDMQLMADRLRTHASQAKQR